MVEEDSAELFNRPDRAFRRAEWIEQRIASGATQDEIATELQYEAEKAGIQRHFSKASVSAHHAAWSAVLGADLAPDVELFSVAFRVTSTGRTASRRDEVVREARRLPAVERRRIFVRGMTQIVTSAGAESSASPVDQVIRSIYDLKEYPLTGAEIEKLHIAVTSLKCVSS